MGGSSVVRVAQPDERALLAPMLVGRQVAEGLDRSARTWMRLPLA